MSNKLKITLSDFRHDKASIPEHRPSPHRPKANRVRRDIHGNLYNYRLNHGRDIFVPGVHHRQVLQ